ncbi:alpha/beta fold hydrolase [Spirosoma litoris]
MPSISTPSDFLVVNGLRIHYIDKNKDQQPAIVFIHGRGLSLKSWGQQLNSTLLATYRLVAFDFPGHGLSEQSSHPLSDYTFQGSIHFLTGVIHQLQLNQFVLVGNSLGGHIALEAIPTLTGCLGVFAMTIPVVKPIQFDQLYRNGELLGKVYSENPAPDDVLAYIKSLLRPDATKLPEFLASDFYKTDSKVHQAIVHTVVSGEYADETELIRKTNVPVAIVAGSEDQIHNLAYLEIPNPAIWRKNPQFVQSAGHLVAWENPEDINRLLVDFVNDCHV